MSIDFGAPMDLNSPEAVAKRERILAAAAAGRARQEAELAARRQQELDKTTAAMGLNESSKVNPFGDKPSGPAATTAPAGSAAQLAASKLTKQVASTSVGGLGSAALGGAKKLVPITKDSAKEMISGAKSALSQKAGGLTDKLLSKASGKLGGLDKLGGISEGLNERLSVLSNTKLAPTMFKAGAKDEMLAVDALGVSDAGILNTLSDKIKSFASSAMEGLRENKSSILGDLKDMVVREGRGFKLDSGDLKGRVIDMLGGRSGSLNGLSATLQKAVTQGLGVDPASYSKVTGMIGDVAVEFESGNLRDARGLFDMAARLTGDGNSFRMNDVGAESNLLSGLFSEAIDLGIPEMIDVLGDNASSQESVSFALRGVLDGTIEKCDFKTMNKTIDKWGGDAVLADAPQAAGKMLGSYVRPRKSNSKTAAADAAEIKTTLDRLDPTWRTCARGTEQVSSLSGMANASPDAVQLLQVDPEIALEVMIANSYPVVDIKREKRRMHPMIALR